MTDFCPEGYLPTGAAIVIAAERWFYDEFARIETAAAAGRQSGSDKGVDALARALSQAQIPDVLQLALQSLVYQVVHRLRNFLHLGKLTSYYFGDDGCQPVSRDFWATAQADGVMESGIYWPFGQPTRLYESRPNYSLFLLQSELDALLSEQPAKKRPLPGAKMPELVAALRELDGLPNRAAQLQALCNMPEFREFKITNALFREAARHVPREAGRRSRRDS
jgi:hypothetical protein